MCKGDVDVNATLMTEVGINLNMVIS